MNIAVLSDIHSNKFALASTLKFLENKTIDRFIFLGDYFGYYPWAQETFLLLKSCFPNAITLLGNHDKLILANNPPNPIPEYWDVINQNKNNLSSDAIQWLSNLNPEAKFVLDGINFSCYHGTPDDSLMGRYYPDNINEYKWFPKQDEIVLMGHTHYPILKKTINNGLIINPGSVGQSRDGNLDSSICIINTNDFNVNFFRIPYPINDAIKELTNTNWYPRAIKSLQKNTNFSNNK